VLTKLQGKNVQAVVNWSIVPAQAIVPKNMKQMGMDVPLYQSHGFGNIKFVEQAGKRQKAFSFRRAPPGADQLPDDHPQKAVLDAVQEGLLRAGTRKMSAPLVATPYERPDHPAAAAEKAKRWTATPSATPSRT